MPRWKKLLKEAIEAAKAAKAIADKAADESRQMTEDERKDYDAKRAEAGTKKAESDKLKKDADDTEFLSKLAGTDGDAPEDGGDPDGDGGDGPKTKDRLSFGERFTKSEPYQEFAKQHPSGVSEGTPINIGRVKVGSMQEWYESRRKAWLGTPISQPQPIRMPMLDQVERDRLTLLDLISRGQTGGNFEYLQVIGVTRGADVVPEATSAADAAALKPLSEIDTELADAKVFTYADGYDVTNQLLADAPAFGTYMNQELRYSLDNIVEHYLLNGTGAGGEPKGILSTTGVQIQEYATVGAVIDPATAKLFVIAVRKAITKVTRLQGGNVTGIVLSPEMDEAIDLLEDANERFYGQGPFGSGPQTLWGRPRVTSERLVDTQAILGDWKQVALLDREGLSVMAFNQHKDYAQRNLTYVRAELRAAQVIWKPNRLVLIRKPLV